jgi:hypothetical protein
MATSEERTTTREARESLFYERCWRCRCVVPNGLVRRRTMKTGYSSGTYIGTGAAVASLNHYDTVSLCGVCDDELETAERQRLDKSFRRWSWVGRVVGLAYGTMILTRIGMPFAVSFTLMLTFVYFRVLGRAILTMHVVTPLADVIGYPAPRYTTPVMASWGLIWAGLIGWQLWYPENRPWPFRHVPQDGRTKPVNQSTTPAASLPSGGPPS